MRITSFLQYVDITERLYYNQIVKLTAQVKLLTDDSQFIALQETLAIANQACNAISETAWETKTFRQFPLHKLTYQKIRQTYPLSAQVVVRCISKVADAYKVSRKKKRVFDEYGAIAFDNRILSWYLEKFEVSIWTVRGRMRIPFVCGDRQRELLKAHRGESDLCLIDGKFYLFAACDVETPEVADVEDVLGIDMGIVNLAVDSDGEIFSGDKVEENRRKYTHRRRNLQRKGTKSAKRKLKKLSGKQARFQKQVNHTISKRIVQKAKDTNRAIAIENLTGIRDRVTVSRKQRARHANWSFYQLVCGCVDKRNRVTQDTFSCVSCGFSALADHVAARNIWARAAVNQPMVSELTLQGQAVSFSRR
jgi:IS605 OrfB family transposase